MIKWKFPNYPLFQEITQKLKTEEIYFQIENQDCYLVRSGTEQLHKIKIGNLSLTKEYNQTQWIKEMVRKLNIKKPGGKHV